MRNWKKIININHQEFSLNELQQYVAVIEQLNDSSNNKNIL